MSGGQAIFSVERRCTIPVYDFVCDDDHVTEQRAGYDDDDIDCPAVVGLPDFPGDRYAVTLHACGKKAKRRAVYRSQGVIFKGDGFTRSVIVPDAPAPTSTAKLTTDERMEVLDDFAKIIHAYDSNVRPYKKEECNARRPPSG